MGVGRVDLDPVGPRTRVSIELKRQRLSGYDVPGCASRVLARRSVYFRGPCHGLAVRNPNVAKPDCCIWFGCGIRF